MPLIEVGIGDCGTGDYTGDGAINVLDIVLLVNLILND